ncbi:Acylphosphatase-like domain-containing protein [Schizophyllum fasciatum]
MSTKRVAFTVHGLVQGVNYRNFAVQRAVSDHVTGWVKNANDGTVVGEAQGNEAQLHRFMRDLHEGPPASNVSKVEQKELDPIPGEDDFQRKR